MKPLFFYIRLKRLFPFSSRSCQYHISPSKLSLLSHQTSKLVPHPSYIEDDDKSPAHHYNPGDVGSDKKNPILHLTNSSTEMEKNPSPSNTSRFRSVSSHSDLSSLSPQMSFDSSSLLSNTIKKSHLPCGDSIKHDISRLTDQASTKHLQSNYSSSTLRHIPPKGESSYAILGSDYEQGVAKYLLNLFAGLEWSIKGGHAGDGGIDLRGHWHLPDGHFVSLIAQCKRLTNHKRVTPNWIRELESSLSYQSRNTLGWFISTNSLSEQSLEHLKCSSFPLAFFQIPFSSSWKNSTGPSYSSACSDIVFIQTFFVNFKLQQHLPLLQILPKRYIGKTSHFNFHPLNEKDSVCIYYNGIPLDRGIQKTNP